MVNLMDAEIGTEYVIREIMTEDEEMDAFLFSLGCYSGEPITVISRHDRGCFIRTRDGERKFLSSLLLPFIYI